MQKIRFINIFLTSLFFAGILNATESKLSEGQKINFEDAEDKGPKNKESDIENKSTESLNESNKNKQGLIKIGFGVLGVVFISFIGYFLMNPGSSSSPTIIPSSTTAFSLQQQHFDCAVYALTNSITHSKTVFSEEANQRSFIEESKIVFEDLKKKIENLLVLLNFPELELNDQTLLANLDGANSYQTLFSKYLRDDIFLELQNRFAATIYPQNPSLCPGLREFGLNLFLKDITDSLNNKHSFEHWWNDLNNKYLNGEGFDMSKSFQKTKETSEDIWRNADLTVAYILPNDKIKTELDMQIFTWLKMNDKITQNDIDRAVSEKKLTKDVLITNNLPAFEYLEATLLNLPQLIEQAKIAFKHLFETGKMVLPVLFNQGGHFVCVAIDLNEEQPIFVRDSCSVHNKKPNSLDSKLQQTINSLQQAFKKPDNTIRA